MRRIMPYRASDDKTDGVVIAYEDVNRNGDQGGSAQRRQATG